MATRKKHSGAHVWEENLESLRKQASGAIGDATAEIIQGSQNVYESLRDTTEQVAEGVSSGVKEIDRCMRDRPLAIAIGAFLIGLMIGKSLRK
jgi:ElaB/YqjD/DUF883 family membrane-anchored ribosome-binding protein